VNICVVALGKIGLPLAVQFARSGHQVVGADVDTNTVELVNGGSVPFPGEADLADFLREEIERGSLRATTDTSAAVSESDVVVVVVPLIVDGDKAPDFRALDAATADIASGLRPGTLVVYETTLPVWTTRTRFAPALAQGSGLALGTDLFVAFSPERVYSGRIFSDLRRYPKLVGGIDDQSERRAAEFYEAVLQFDERSDLGQENGVWTLGSAEAAELAKLAETTYRDVNIAFANELAVFAERSGIDVGQVIDACNSQPFSHIHRPGVAVGGHCIPVYPHFLLSNAPEARVVAAARRTNDSMPASVVDRLASSFVSLDGLRVVVLGACYRGGVKETAFSGVFALVETLRERGVHASVHDPLLTDDELVARGLVPYHFGDLCDGAIVQTDHSEYRHLTPRDITGVRVLVDGRNVVDTTEGWEGVTVHRLGVGTSS
jgi:nucleotide sugar dehydrogenase